MASEKQNTAVDFFTRNPSVAALALDWWIDHGGSTPVVGSDGVPVGEASAEAIVREIAEARRLQACTVRMLDGPGRDEAEGRAANAMHRAIEKAVHFSPAAGTGGREDESDDIPQRKWATVLARIGEELQTVVMAYDGGTAQEYGDACVKFDNAVALLLERVVSSIGEPVALAPSDEEIINLAVVHEVAQALRPIGMDTGRVLYTHAGYKTSEILAFARALLAAGDGRRQG